MMDFSGSSVGKGSTHNAGYVRELGLIPELGRSPGEGNGNPIQYSCLGNSMDRGAWWATLHGVTKSQTGLKRLSMDTCIHIMTHHFSISNIHHLRIKIFVFRPTVSLYLLRKPSKINLMKKKNKINLMFKSLPIYNLKILLFLMIGIYFNVD